MTLLRKDTFICLDCESTGLDPHKDRIIEIAVAKFRFDEIIDSFDTLINPLCDIPFETQSIHHISNEMVFGKPTIKSTLPKIFSFIQGHIIVGHGIAFDLELLWQEAKREQIAHPSSFPTYIDTLRLARLYGKSNTNSLESLRQHFNIPEEGAHRAMSDVTVNIEVFKHLAKDFTTTPSLLDRLQKPVQLKNMPLGKHKGRSFSEIPLDYLQWAIRQDFDGDLLFSIKSELAKRKDKSNFSHATNPFSIL